MRDRRATNSRRRATLLRACQQDDLATPCPCLSPLPPYTLLKHNAAHRTWRLGVARHSFSSLFSVCQWPQPLIIATLDAPSDSVSRQQRAALAAHHGAWSRKRASPSRARSLTNSASVAAMSAQTGVSRRRENPGADAAWASMPTSPGQQHRSSQRAQNGMIGNGTTRRQRAA
ncbi:hypothetical protein FA95DRAFT_765804 [Auriscalpium vulgare]|uniref:Uncharacterized protein n=1 Tax=Auriscalpium vulgare TaxID=40419 RepID=A0ACB8RAK8_9AGAM|nr:hypothetical protein FA95DRAFT_765804 [Auriscalpium vulgare]